MRWSSTFAIVAFFCVTLAGCGKSRSLDEVSEPPKDYVVSEVKVNSASPPSLTEPLILVAGEVNSFSIVIKHLAGAAGSGTGTVKLIKPDGAYLPTIQSTSFQVEPMEVGKSTRLQFDLKVPQDTGDALLQLRDVKAGVICEMRCVLK